MSADDARRVAQARARRAAALARRADAARRRGVLTGVLLVASVVAWAVVGLTSVGVMAAIVPTVLLAGVVALGRRAVVTAQRADAAWERQQERAARAVGPRPRVTGRAHHPSDSHTEAIAQVGSGAAGATAATVTASTPVVDDVAASDDTVSSSSDAAEPAEPGDAAVSPEAAVMEESADAKESEGWSPVPVPRPTYTTKATAPRREPVPLVVEEPAAAAVAPASDVADDTSSAPDDAAPTTPSLDLDAILARRRAVGE